MNAKPTIGIFGHDQGANNVLNGHQEALAESFSVDRVGDGKVNYEPNGEDVERIATQAHALILGLSVGQEEARFAERVLKQNQQLSGRIYLVEDYPDTALLRGGDIAANSTACTIYPAADDSLGNAFGQIETIGEPVHWMEDMRNIQLGAESRANEEIIWLEKHGATSTANTNDAFILYVEGWKNPETEAATIEKLLELGDSVHGKKIIIHYRGHPGTATQEKVDAAREAGKPTGEIERLEKIVASRPRLEVALSRCTHISSHNLSSGPAVLRGTADLVISAPKTTGNLHHPVTPAELSKPTSLNRTLTCLDLITTREALPEGIESHIGVIENKAEFLPTVTALLDPNSPESRAFEEKLARFHSVASTAGDARDALMSLLRERLT